ncbi:MAG TPA: aconitate hydratase B, partial [Acidobacteriota bacterium]|nr:aconitate hydratase B [Acidobacteriota bacterium]
MLEAYLRQEKERGELGIPPLPLSSAETEEVCRSLEGPDDGGGKAFLALLRDRVSPGVDPAAKVKAEWLARVARGETAAPAVSRQDAVYMLGTMLGGYNIAPLVALLGDRVLGGAAAEALKRTILVYGAFDEVVKMSAGDPNVRAVLESWAAGEWFLSRPAFPETLTLKIFKVDGEINTDDFSPAKHAST